MAVVDMKPIDIGFAKVRYGERLRVTLLDGRVFEGTFWDYTDADDSPDYGPYIEIDERPDGVPSRSLQLAIIQTVEIVDQ